MRKERSIRKAGERGKVRKTRRGEGKAGETTEAECRSGDEHRAYCRKTKRLIPFIYCINLE
jgi:hypothetical protein